MPNPLGNPNFKPDPHWQFKKGQSGNPSGRPKKLLSTLKNQGYTKYDITATIEVLLALTKEEIEEIEKDEERTMLERIMAAALLKSFNTKSLYSIDNLLTRAHGAPKQQIEQTNINKEITVTFKKIELIKIEEAEAKVIEPPKEGTTDNV